MGAQLGTSGAINDINMTPLIDIVLVVLIIMMVNMPVEVEQMGVKLPAVVEDPPPPPKEPVDQLVVALYQDGKLALNKTVLEPSDLAAQITLRLRSMTQKTVFIDAHPDITYGRVVDIVDLAKESGAVKVAFAKLKEDGPAPWTEVGVGAMPRGVYPGSPGVVGAITEKRADEQFQPLMPSVLGCYETRLAANPTLTGNLVLRVDVGPEGEVMATEVVSRTTNDPELESCILEKVPALRYEPLGYPNTARIHYPLVFSPG